MPRRALAQLASTASPPVRAAATVTCPSPAPPIWQQCGTWQRASGSCGWAMPAHALTSTGACLGPNGRQSVCPVVCVRACLCLAHLSGSLCVCRAAGHVASGPATNAVGHVLLRTGRSSTFTHHATMDHIMSMLHQNAMLQKGTACDGCRTEGAAAAATLTRRQC
jgi:hypothetical protein